MPAYVEKELVLASAALLAAPALTEELLALDLLRLLAHALKEGRPRTQRPASDGGGPADLP